MTLRRLFKLTALFVLALAACAGTPEPSPAPSATSRAPAPTALSQAPAPTAGPATAGTSQAASPSPSPSALPSGSPPPVPRSDDSAWPAFLRELDFGIPAGNSYGPLALAFHARLDRIYVRTHSQAANEAGQVTVLDHSSGQVLALVETGPDSYAEGDLAMDAKRNRVYAVNTDDASCSIFDAETLETIATLQGVDHLAVDADGGRLYIAGLGGLRILDAESYSILREKALAHAPRTLLLGLDPAKERVYLAYQEADSYTLARYDASTLQELGTTRLPGRPDDLVADPNRDRVYITLNDGKSTLLWSLSGEGQLVKERVLGEWYQRTHLALDPAGDRLFLGREAYPDSSLSIVDLQSGREMADLPLDVAPNSLAWDGEAGRLLVSHTYANQIRVVDPEAGETVALFPTALDLVDLAVDALRGYLLITDTAGRLHVLEADSDEELAILLGEGRIAVDSPHGRLYTGGEGAKHVRLFDADTLQQSGEIHSTAKPVADAYHGDLLLVENGIYLTSLETMTTTAAIPDTLPQAPGYSPNPAAVDAVVDPGSGRLFAIINNGVPGSNSGTYLYVYEAETYQKVLTDTERSPIFVDVDPTTGRAFVSRIHLAGRSTSLLENGRAYTARLDAVFGALRVDPSLGRLYLSLYGEEEGYLLVLNANNLDVLGSVPIPGGFSLRALDPQRKLLYLAAQDGRVQVWTATGGELAVRAKPVPARPLAEEIHHLFLGPGDISLFTGSLYRSDDDGESWQQIGKALPQAGVQLAVASPDFARDATLFAIPVATDVGWGIWKSTDGGQSWRMANRGLSDLAVTDLAISPGFAVDQTLFAITRRQGLFRSTDGGQTWVRLTDRYHPSDAYASAYNVYLSPDYAQDGTVFVAHDGLQRSTDGGQTWVRTLSENASVAFSPQFMTDHTLFGWSGSAGVLRSTDGGSTWQPISAGLSLTGFGPGQVIISPDYPTSQTVYLISTSLGDTPAQYFRSTDAGMTWEWLAGEPPQAATPVELSADGTAFVALDDEGRLLRWPVEDLSWEAVTLPPLTEVTIESLFLSPNFDRDRTLYALTAAGSILRSGDAGLTWTDTGFPLRTSHPTMLDLVIVPPQTLLVGTPLGLYRSDDGETWLQVVDGLPPEPARSRPQRSADGSLRLLISGQVGDDAPRLFLSTDGGESWTEPVPPLPEVVTVEDLQLSPAFATDHTAFIYRSWDKPWRTIRGEEWQGFGPPGEWNLSAMQLSPAFDQDGLLFVRLEDNRLWRSTDRGDSWTEVSGPWGGEAPMALTRGTGYLLDTLTLSPTFAEDSVILTRAGNALYWSADRGTTWTKVLDLQPMSARVAFTPSHAQDHLIYLLQGHTLYQSPDGGRRWRALPSAPWEELDEVELLLSPTFSQDRTLLGWTRAGQVYQSRDGGQSWRDVGDGLPAMTIQQVLFSPSYATDGLLYLVPFGPGLFKRVGDSPWTASTDKTPPPTPRPRPPSTPTPSACASEPNLFLSVWQQASDRLGCPEQRAAPVTLAEQSFEHGRMIWDSSDRQIYVLSEAGRWQRFEDTFLEGVDPAYESTLPPPPLQPQRGFGKVWREQLGGPQAAVGWAVESERAFSGWRQPFERGLLIWTDAILAGEQSPGTAYLLYEDGTWQAIRTPAP